MGIISDIFGGLTQARLPQAPATAAPIVGPPGSNPVHVRLLALNDFHGQLGDSDAKVGAQGIGGAATLAAYINKERAENPNGTVLLSSGDAFGASPPESSLLNHEPTMAALAGMGVNIATPGNHEFDRGYSEWARLVRGGQRTRKNKKGKTVGVGSKWPGSPFPWVSANLVDTKSGKPVLPPYVIMNVNGVKVAFIGAVTKNLKNVTKASGVKNVTALDPADAINGYIPELKAKGVRTIVAFMHEGGEQDEKSKEITGPIVDICKRLDPEVDVVMSAHSHKEYATNVHGKILVQGGSYAKAFSAVDLAVDPKTGDVVAGSARVVRNDEKGIAPDPTVDSMVKMFEKAVAPRTQRVISVLPGDVSRETSPAGESALGTLIAEAQRKYAGADIGMMNPGGLRQDVAGGPITWGKLFSVQPFNNRVMRMPMTGTQILAVLEQQFQPGKTTILQLAGMRVWMDPSKPAGKRITKVVTDDGKPLDKRKVYIVAANNFLADGGDNFTAFPKKGRTEIGSDLDALVKYLAAGGAVPTAPIGRINLAAGAEPVHGH